MSQTGELRDLTFRLDQEVDAAFTTYCDRAKRRKRDVISQAVVYYDRWLKSGGPSSLDGTYYLFLQRHRRSKRKTVVRGTVITEAGFEILAEMRGTRSIGRTINDALRVFFWEQDKLRVRAHDRIATARFAGGLPNFGTAAELAFKELPTGQKLLRDQTGAPPFTKGAPILIDSSYLLGLMLQRTTSFILDCDGNPAKGSLLDHALLGDVVLSTTTAQIAEFAEKAAGFLTAQHAGELREYFTTSLGRELPRGLEFHLVERLKVIPALGIAIFPVEASDYVDACAIHRGNWPVTLAKLAGIAAMKRITEKDDILCLSLYRTGSVPTLPVWERFMDGYCVEASSCDPSFENYSTDWIERDECADSKFDHLERKTNPYLKKPQGLKPRRRAERVGTKRLRWSVFAAPISAHAKEHQSDQLHFFRLRHPRTAP